VLAFGLPQAAVGSGGLNNVPITVVANTPLSVTHNLNTTSWIATVYDGSNNVVELLSPPKQTGVNTATLTSSTSFTGRVVFVAGGQGHSFPVTATANTPFTITHNYGTTNISGMCYDASDQLVTPFAGPNPATTNTATVTFTSTATYRCHLVR
jgi:hypothetical protein